MKSLRCRGQHTKTTGRKGRTVGVSKKKVMLIANIIFVIQVLLKNNDDEQKLKNLIYID